MSPKSNPIQFDLFGHPIEDRARKENGREIIKLDFQGQRVRTVVINGEPWWVASDTCRVLGITNHRDALARCPDDEKGVANTDTLGGKQDLLIVNEAGLYRLIFTSRKPEAEAFKRWVFHEVLPQIRKTGGYTLSRTARIARKNRCDLDTARVRADQIDANKRSSGRLYESGASVRDFADWHNGAYRGQFERTAGELRGVLGLSSHSTPLDRMERAPLSCNLHAKIIAEKIIEEREREGRPIPVADQPALLESIAREMASSDLHRIGPGSQYGLKEHPRRGLVIDVIRALPVSA